MRLDPQMLEVIEKRKALAPALEVDGPLGIEEIRAVYNQERSWWNAVKPELSSVENIEIQGPVRPLPLRIYQPLDKCCNATLIYLHGGGWVVGNLDTHDRVMRLLCEYSGAAVLGVDYALSPEYRMPVAIDEILTTWHWLHSTGKDFGLHPERTAIGGDSAGANLAVSVTQALHQRTAGAVKGLLLYYGAFGLSASPSWHTYGTTEYEFTWEEMAFYLDSYLGDPSNRDDPRYNVLRGDLACLPPAFIAAAQCDPLCDDSSALYEAMRTHGVDAELKIYPGVLHGFIHYSRMLDQASVALLDGASALRALVR